MALVHERIILTKLVGEVSPTFANRGCHMVSSVDPYDHNIGFLD
jgi:hypothetical protein